MSVVRQHCQLNISTAQTHIIQFDVQFAIWPQKFGVYKLSRYVLIVRINSSNVNVILQVLVANFYLYVLILRNTYKLSHCECTLKRGRCDNIPR